MINLEYDTITLEGEIKIPPRVEYIMALATHSVARDQEHILIERTEIKDQLIIGNVLSTVRNGHVLVSVINLSDEEKTLAPLCLNQLEFETFTDVMIAQVNIEDTDSNKLKNPARIVERY
jgi:hypothetical protein